MGASEDRISALPDPVIQHILSFLPSTREAVRTSLLSKSWRRQWTHVPALVFEPWVPSGDEYFSIIDHTLSLHDSAIIKKFHLCYDHSSNLDPQFISKIRVAVRKCVEELILICNCAMGSYLLPKFLIECESLVRLEMENCYIKSDWTVNLPSLKSLKMDARGYRVDDRKKVVDNFVSGCPLLEWLELRGFIVDNVAFFPNSLKVLSFVHAEINTAVGITFPNLVELNLKSCTFPGRMIENVLSSSPLIHSLKLVHCWGSKQVHIYIASNSLKVLHLEYVNYTEITISCPNLVKLDVLCYDDTLCEVVDLPSTVCATLDYDHNSDNKNLENKLLELFQHVRTLTIHRSLVEVISDLDKVDRPPLPLLKSKCLILNIGASFGLALPGIAHALGSPMLETLVIKLDSKFREEAYLYNYQDKISSRLDYWNSIKSTSFTCLVSHLKTVKIIGFYERDDNREIVLEFIEER